MSSTCYNVFLYAWLNDNFRKELKRVLPCFTTTVTSTNALPGPTVTQAANLLAAAVPRDDLKRNQHGLIINGESLHRSNPPLPSAQVNNQSHLNKLND